MVKGTKRKIEIKKRDTKEQRAVAFSKRRQTLFSKAADLCLLSGANIAVFVTSPSDNSEVIYSFSGYSPASEIADCYLNGKTPPQISNPQPRFWWEDRELYRSCDISELTKIEERLQKLKKQMTACLENKVKFSNSDQNNSISMTCSLDDDQNLGTSVAEKYGASSSHSHLNPSSPSEIASFNQIPSVSSLHKINGDFSTEIPNFSFEETNGASCSQFVSGSDGNPSSEIASFDQIPSISSLHKINCESSTEIPNFSFEEINGASCSQFVSGSDGNPSSEIASSDQIPSVSSLHKINGESSREIPNFSFEEINGASCSQFVSSSDENPSSEIASFDQIPSVSSLDKINGESSTGIPNFTFEEINDVFSSCELANEDAEFADWLWETDKEINGMSVPEATQTLPTDQSFWDNIFNEDVFGLNNTINGEKEKEDDYMIDVAKVLNQEEMEFTEFTDLFS